MLLLVDDDDLFRAALADNLRDDGYEVVEYHTTRSVPIATLSQVRALLIDWAIEHPHGRGFVERFHNAVPAAQVIVITAATNQAEPSATPSHLIFLPKPLSYDVLMAALGPAVPHRQI